MKKSKNKSVRKTLGNILPEDYYRTIVDSSLDMIITVDKDRRIVEFNKSAQETFGYTLDEVLGKPAGILYANPEDGERISKEVKEKGKCIAEVMNRKKNGEIFQCFLSASLLKNPEGEVIGIMGISRDISEKKLFEKKLELASQEWRATFDAVKDAMVLLDENGIIKRCNLAFSTILNKTFREIIGVPFFKIFDFPEENFPYSKSRKTLKRETSIYKKDGKWLSISSDPILKDGKFAGAVIIISDITALEESKEKLKRSEEKYRLLFESAPDVICSIKNGKIVSLNPVFEKVTGWSKEQWLNRHFINFIHKEDVPVALESFRKIFSTKEITKCELRMVSKDGEYLIGEYTFAPLIENNKIVGVIGIARDITEYRKAIDYLKESEGRFRMLTENSPIGISLLRADDTFEYLNPKFIELFGYILKDIPTKDKWFELAYPDEEYRKEVVSYWENDFVKSPHPERLVERDAIVTCKDGKKKIVRVRTVIMENGKKLQTYLDITETKKAEELLAERERRFRSLIENATDIISMFDSKGKILYISPSVEKILGYKDEDVIGKFVFDFLHPSNVEEGKKNFFSIASQQTISSPFRFKVRHKNGSWRYLEAIFNNLLADPNISAILMNARDITSIVHAEEKYRKLFEESKDVVYIMTPEGRILDINPAGVELFGYSSKQEIIKANMYDFFSDLQSKKKYKETIERDGYLKDFELVLKNKIGDKLIVLDSVTVVKDEVGNVTAYRGLMRDVTQYKKLEQELLHAQKMDALGVLTGGIAHDFNNMLQVIIGFTELALAKLEPSNPLLNDLLKIKNTSQKAAELVQKLLAFSKKRVLEKKVVTMNEFIFEYINILKRIIPENIEIFVSTKAEKSTAFIDSTSIEQVIMNIVLNARDAMPKGGRLVIETENIEIKNTDKERGLNLKEGEYIVISFTDNGTGIEEEIIPKIFEPFFTSKEKGRGVGLGLSVAWGIVKQHEGHIEVISKLGEGSTFKVFLPLYKSEKQKTYENSENIKLKFEKGQETILVSEDEKEIRELLKDYLESFGYKVLLAKDGNEALEIFKTNKESIDLVILDLIMPKVGGYEVYQKISSSAKEIPVIFITGYSEETTDGRIEKNHRIEIVTKPFSPGTIVEKIRTLLTKNKFTS